MLTRVWAAVAVARDRRWRENLASPIARNVLDSHLEARQRGLQLLLEGRNVSTQQAVTVNRLRRRVERWTDVLLGGLWHLGELSSFAIDADRAHDFACELASRQTAPDGHSAWRLTLASLRNAFQLGISPVAASPDANARIAASILGCFQEELFDSTGLFHSPWMMRLTATASDAQIMINELLQPHTMERASQSSKRRPR